MSDTLKSKEVEYENIISPIFYVGESDIRYNTKK